MLWIVVLLIILFLILIIILCFHNYILNKEIKNITLQLKNFTDGNTHKRIDISFVNDHVEDLAEAINDNIEYQEQLKIDILNKERKLKDTISNISHDLRTPLTSIVGYLFLMKNSKNQDMDEALEVVDNKVNLLNELIQELYEVSLMESEEYRLEMEQVDMVAVVADCLAGSFHAFSEKEIIPAIHLPDHAVYIKGNKTGCQRIIQNLITNAIRYTVGSVEVSVSSIADACIFTILNETDQMTKEDVQHMFERFYTADKARENGGTGLGLYIVKILLDKMNGSVKEVSHKNNMLSITILFPLWL